jgi:hypothetical protein
MKTLICSILVIMFFALLRNANAGSGWLIYHERSFKGKIIDAGTKEPIEGAVVVAQYHLNMLGPTGFNTILTDVQEVLTDEKGEFFIPSFTKFIIPISIGDDTSFLVWKPGYKPENIWGAYFFAKEPGTTENRPVHAEGGLVLKPVRLGIVELVEVKTKQDRLLGGMPSPIGEPSDYKKQKRLIKLINEEGKHLGLKGKIKIEGERDE